MRKFEQVYSLFFKQGEVVEIRAYGLRGKSKAYEGWAAGAGIVFGYFDSSEYFAKCAAALEAAKAPGIYFTLNPINPDLLARAANRLKAADQKTVTTADKDVVAIRWLPIDLDPKRPTGISASTEELNAAKALGEDIYAWFKETYQAVGVRALSGNGVHLTYKLPDLKPTEENIEKIKSCLLSLQDKFGTHSVDIDCKVFNPARIWKLYGTTARKGDSVPDRPHRKSSISQKFKKKDLNLVDFLDDLASRAPKPKEAQKSATSGMGKGEKSPNTRSEMAKNLGPVDLEQYLSHYSVAFNIKAKSNKTLYRLDVCLFDESHKKNESAIVQDPSGKITYQCFHDSCRNNTWAMARNKISGSESLAQFCEGYDHNYKPEGSTSGRGKTKGRKDYLSVSKKSGKLIVNQARLANYMIEKLSPIFHEGRDISDIFYRYEKSKGVWKITPKADIENAITNELDDLSTATLLRNTLYLLKAKTYLPKHITIPDPMFLNLQNGMLDVRTQELFPHNPKYFSRAQLSVSYKPGADMEPWARTINSIHADDLEKVNVLQQFAGYCLYPGIVFPCALIQIGGGGNGKGTVEHVLCKMLGDDNISHISLKRMADDFGPIELKDKLLNTTGETESSTIDVTNFKSICAGDEIQAQVKFKPDVKFTPIAKHMISANDFPVVKDKTRAFYRRVIVMEYKQVFKGDNDKKGLREELVDECLDGVFMWALEGLRHVLEHKKIDIPESMVLAKQRFRERGNNVLTFVDEECILDKNSYTAKPELFDRYKIWCKDSNLKPFGKQRFYEYLELGFKEIRPGRPYINGVQASKIHYLGIRLRGDLI